MLPDGWTIERVMAVAQGPAEVVPTDVPMIVDDVEAQIADRNQADDGHRNIVEQPGVTVVRQSV